MHNVIQIPIRGFDENFSYFVHDGKSKAIAIVDPGDIERLEMEIAENDWRPKMIWITHSHFDHIQGVQALAARYEIPVYCHDNAIKRINVPANQIVQIKDNDSIQLGELAVNVLETPGHINDAVCFFIAADEASDGVAKVITGDTLFVDGCGRADLDGSNVEDLYLSLQKLKNLSPETEVYAGHDYGSKPVSTIGWELLHNKYMLCDQLADFIEARSG